jgi:hypothetical protein
LLIVQHADFFQHAQRDGTRHDPAVPNRIFVVCGASAMASQAATGSSWRNGARQTGDVEAGLPPFSPARPSPDTVAAATLSVALRRAEQTEMHDASGQCDDRIATV